MKPIAALIPALMLVMSLFAAACDSQGCDQTDTTSDSSSDSSSSVTCGPGTHLEGNTCVLTQSSQATTLSN